MTELRQRYFSPPSLSVALVHCHLAEVVWHSELMTVVVAVGLQPYPWWLAAMWRGCVREREGES